MCGLGWGGGVIIVAATLFLAFRRVIANFKKRRSLLTNKIKILKESKIVKWCAEISRD